MYNDFYISNYYVLTIYTKNIIFKNLKTFNFIFRNSLKN